jgi:iron complex outermembrane receptor protein
MAFAAGYDLRHERSVITPAANILSGDIVGMAATQTDAERTFGAVFGELIVPVTDTLETQLAARVDKFPGFGAHVSPKIGLRFQPTKDLLLRATAEGGFRAPNLAEAGTSTKTAFTTGLADPQRCDGAIRYADDLRAEAAALPDSDPRKAGLLALADQAVMNECVGGAVLVVKNNPALKPEVSSGLSFGLEFEPIQDTSFSLDYWQLERQSEIVVKNADELLADEDNLPPGAAVHRAPCERPHLHHPGTAAALWHHRRVADRRAEHVPQRRARAPTAWISAPGPASARPRKLELNLLGTGSIASRSAMAATALRRELCRPGGFASERHRAALTTGPFLNGWKLHYTGSTLMQTPAPNGAKALAPRLQVAPTNAGSRLRWTDYFFAYSGSVTSRSAPTSATCSMSLRPQTARDRHPPPVQDVVRRSLRLAIDYKFL